MIKDEKWIILTIILLIQFKAIISQADNVPRCDGRNIIFVGGFHHSGTTITQATFERLGKPKNKGEFWNSGEHEYWPTEKVACWKTYRIFKHPTNSFDDVDRMIHLRETLHMPKMKLIFMIRDLPNTVWSLMKRAAAMSNKGLAEKYAAQWCLVQKTWYEARMNDPLDWTIDINAFTHFYRVFENQILPDSHYEIKQYLRRLIQVEDPPEMSIGQANHTLYRGDQVRQPIQPYNPGAYVLEATTEMAHFLHNLSCTNLINL